MGRIKKQRIIKVILSIILLILVYYVLVGISKPNINSISTNLVIGDNQTYYVLENERFYDGIFELDINGEMIAYKRCWNLSISNEVKDIYYAESLYYLEKTLEADSIYYYVTRLNEELNTGEIVAKIPISSKEIYKDFVIEDDQVILLTVSNQSNQVNIYSQDINETDSSLTVAMIQSEESQTFIECEYSNGYAYFLTNTGKLQVVGSDLMLTDLQKDYLIAGIRKSDEGILVYDNTNNRVVEIVNGEKDEVIVDECYLLCSVTADGADIFATYTDLNDNIHMVIGAGEDATYVAEIEANFMYYVKVVLFEFAAIVLIFILLFSLVFVIKRLFVKSSDFSAKLVIMVGVLIIPTFLIVQIAVYKMNGYNQEQEFINFTSLYSNVIAKSLSKLDYSDISLDSYSDTDGYTTVKEIFEDAYEIDQAVINYLVYTDDSGVDYIVVGEDVTYGVYTQAALELPLMDALTDCVNSGLEVNGSYTIDKQAVTYSVIPVDGQIIPEVFLVSIISAEHLEQEQLTVLKNVFLYGGVLLLLLFSIAYAWICNIVKPVKILSYNMEKVTKGDYNIKEIIVRNDEFGKMWVSLKQMVKVLELKKQVESTVVEKYYQFTHKDIEQYFGKNTITEIREKEHVILNGFIGFVYTKLGDSQMISDTQSVLTRMEEMNHNEKKVIIPAAGDLSVIELGYPELTNEGIKELYQGIYHDTDTNQEFVFMDYNPFEFGVVNINQRYYTYLKAKRMQYVQQYRQEFLNVGARFIITEEAKNKSLEITTNDRYIGYLNSEWGRIHLYEVLYPEYTELDRRKAQVKDRIKQGLEMYYDGKIYEAREIFYEITKDNTNDGVAHWYISKCNQSMRNTDELDFSLFE